MPGVALLRHRRASSLVPVSQRHSIQPSSFHLRLVVQREMRTQSQAVRHQRTPLPETQTEPNQTPPTDYQTVIRQYILEQT